MANVSDKLKADHQRLVLEIADLETESIQLSKIITNSIDGAFPTDLLRKANVLQGKIQDLVLKKSFLHGMEYATREMGG